MRRILEFMVLLVGLALVGAAPAREPQSGNSTTKEKAAAATDAFERLKKLAGEWQLVGDEAKNETAIRFQLVSKGSAVVETLFPGSPKEMVTVYHLNGDRILMTHYCCCGNQPRMCAQPISETDKLAFEFVDVSNLTSEKDMHMHGLQIRFIDDNHLHTEWEYFVNGKSGGKHAFDLVRRK